MTRWERVTYPLELYDLETGDQVSPHGWTTAAQRKATSFYGQWARERLRKEGQAVSTGSLVKEGRGREHLGYSLTAKGVGLTEYDRRVMLQARSHCFPTAKHVARIKRNTKPGASKCKLCRRRDETYGHIQVGCSHLTDAQRTAHNIVAEAALGEIQKQNPRLQVQPEMTLGKWMEGSGHGEQNTPTDIRDFKPDAYIYDEERSRITVWEFTRGMAESEAAFQQREEAKHQSYHGVLTHLRRAFPDHEVEFQALVVCILTSTRQREFDEQLERLGLQQPKARTEVARAVAVAAVRANGYVLRQRADKMAQRGFG